MNVGVTDRDDSEKKYTMLDESIREIERNRSGQEK